jgi:hypothetical protein
MDADTRELLRRVATGYGLVAGLVGVAGLVVLVRRRTPSALVVVLTGVGMLVPPLIYLFVGLSRRLDEKPA